jgi:pre-mRNA-processing factor SLU7
MRNSYCTGAKGRIANDAANSDAVDAFQARKMLDSTAKKDASASSNTLTKRSDIFGDSNPAAVSALDAEKLAKAHRRAEDAEREERKRAAGESAAQSGAGEERKRGYNSMQSVDVTAEDMEVYRMKKVKGDDPMAAFLDSEEVLEYKK